MAGLLLPFYDWMKAFHVVAVIAWMAGMLYLPRLFVYHVEQGQTSPMAPVFQMMEWRLLRFIINPAMAATWIFGLSMVVANPDLLSQGWFHGKLTLVALMSGVHGVLAKYRRELAQGTCVKSARFFRILNEVPTILMIGIVVLVIVRP